MNGNNTIAMITLTVTESGFLSSDIQNIHHELALVLLFVCCLHVLFGCIVTADENWKVACLNNDTKRRPVKFVSGFLAATYSHVSDYKQNYLHVLSSKSAIFANVRVRGWDAKERKHDGNGVGGGQGGKSLRITQSIYTRRRK